MINDSKKWNLINVIRPYVAGNAIFEAEYANKTENNNIEIYWINCTDFQISNLTTQSIDLSDNAIYKNKKLIKSFQHAIESLSEKLTGDSVYTNFTINPILIDGNGNYCLSVEIIDESRSYYENYKWTPKELTRVYKHVILKSNGEVTNITSEYTKDTFHYENNQGWGGSNDVSYHEYSGHQTTNNVIIPMPNKWYYKFEWDSDYANRTFSSDNDYRGFHPLSYQKNKFSIYDNNDKLRLEFYARACW